MEKAIVIARNDVSITYKIGMIDLYVAKAYDEEKDKHFVMCSVPQIPDLKVVKIQMPFEFDNPFQRDSFFDKFDPDGFMYALEKKIKENQKLSQSESSKN